MLYEEWKSRYKNLKNFNTVLQRCPRFWPLAPSRGMNPGVYSLGISEDPPRYLSSKFDASVRSDCWDISIWKTLTQCDGNGNANANKNADDWGDYNSSPCTSYRRAKNKLCWNYFAEMYLMKYLLGLKLINTSERVAYFTKIAGKRRRLVQQQTNKRQLSMSYQQQYIRSRRIASKTIAIRLYLDLLCVFSALVNSAARTRLRI